MKRDDIIAWAERLAPLSKESPSTAFVEFYEHHRGRIRDILRKLKDGDAKMPDFTLRAGMMPPRRAVIHGQIKELCLIPYRTTDGTLAACPGSLRGLKGCPPHAPATAKTIDLLSRARSFLIIQLDGNEAQTQQRHIHPFVARTMRALEEHDYSILVAYASGPCRVCPEGCSEEAECRQPEHRLFAPEACGFWVNALCREAARFPICGDGPQQIRWIRDWRLATQDTDSVRYVTGMLIG